MKNSLPIVTLGPAGTDAETQAKRISTRIILKDSFPEAMECAFRHNAYALVACGYKKVEEGRIVDTWVDLNFRYDTKMKIVKTYTAGTKPICFVIRVDCLTPRTIVVHPATQEFVKLSNPNLVISYVDAKPDAVRLTAIGRFDSCLGSKDVIQKYSNLKVVKTFYPTMIWALYEKN